MKWKLLLLIPVLMFSACDYFTKITLRFSQAEVQKWIEPAFPIKKRDKFVYEIVLKNPKVLLKEGSDEIGVRLKLNVNLLGQPVLTTDLLVDGGLSYNPTKGELYLTQLKIKEPDLAPLLRKIKPLGEIDIEPLIVMLLQEQFKQIPLYRLDSSKFEQSLAQAFLKDVTIKNGQLVMEFSL